MTLHLILAALAGIATIVVLIVWLKVHPFLALMGGSAVMAVSAGVSYTDMFASFTKGVGSTFADVGLLIVLGSIIGTLLISSGGADVIVDTILDKTPVKRLPWAMALIAFVVGIPLFFEVGVVILIPVVMYAAHRAKLPVILLGIPALAGLSVLHGLVPPHPGPLIAISALNANIGMTMGLGLLIAIPVLIISGPLLGRLMAKWVPITAGDDYVQKEADAVHTDDRKPSFGISIMAVLLPVVLMLARTVAELAHIDKTTAGRFLVFLGTPLIALLITAIFAMFVFGYLLGRTRDMMNKLVGSAFGPVAGILLIVGAGGGFKQTLVDSGIAKMIGQGLADANLHPLFAAWLMAVLIRLATGSATVATITAAGIMAPMVGSLPPVEGSLMVLAIGAGSVFLSHVNDAGFWMVKEYFGMTVGQTFKTWSLMETVISVTGLACVMGVSLVVL
ncbi:Gluconate permease (transmembrane) [Propionibacterium freudenreichii]|uniref:GntP family permease n=1 Tax=Propionibacterium freudenreichii TaxID=1744 RepID=UPI0005A5C6CE|nr:gluconate:H+ symporter [Propionibacterium freudenreichii]MCT2995209.1 gluconate transporter [Propionibacterium freudenreichii]MCT3015399.1 gluconate transporter [Propionibacterium freudenreichii]MDK9674378.1 gluconate transporter [Propionibacterium freudenreichii]CEI46684.1 Gluconate permease (transmembrane) [Propionibacterium freudenreichii]SCQ46842.1 Gluconate permease [Propionibacterium freudenreichii]